VNKETIFREDMDMHNKSVDYWATYVTKQAKAHGLLSFWWEIGFTLDRANNVVKDQALLDAIIEGLNDLKIFHP
jgi:hypothetical protein